MKKNAFEQPQIESETIESLSQKLLNATLELSEKNQELKRIQKEQREMMANISHDLRSPITAIRNTVDYLCADISLSLADYQSAIKLIDRRTKTLEDLIADMYYLFCVEDTSRELCYQKIEPCMFFEEYFYDVLADKRYDKHMLILDMEENLSGCIKIDISKIVRVLDNLFTNAAKYSPEGSHITLHVSSLCEDKKLGEAKILKVTVQDTGNGIPAKDLPHIFNRTYTVSSARTPNSSTGSGLGLSIVKAIITRHGGNVSCESTIGVGSAFSFTLPLFEKTE